jgi:putative transcriptional regulator
MSERKRRPLFERLKLGLEDGIRYAKRELTLRSAVVPAPPPPLTARDVADLRQQLRMSQGLFAQVLNVSTKTVQSWEQGRRSPSHASLRLLQVIKEDPQIISNVIGITAATLRQTAKPRNRAPRGAKPRRAKVVD